MKSLSVVYGWLFLFPAKVASLLVRYGFIRIFVRM